MFDELRHDSLLPHVLPWVIGTLVWLALNVLIIFRLHRGPELWTGLRRCFGKTRAKTSSEKKKDAAASDPSGSAGPAKV